MGKQTFKRSFFDTFVELVKPRSKKLDGLRRFCSSVLVNAVLVLVAALILSGVHLYSVWAPLTLGFALALFNKYVRGLILWLASPFTVFSHGLIYILVNGLALFFISPYVRDFKIDSFWAAIWCSVLMSIMSFSFSLYGRLREGKLFFDIKKRRNDGEPRREDPKDFQDADVID